MNKIIGTKKFFKKAQIDFNDVHVKCLLSILIYIVLLILSSCSVKKDEEKKTSQSTSVFSLPENMLDSDSDGIPDAVAIQRGLNPFVANIPRLSIGFVKEVSLGGIFREEVKDKSNDGFTFLKQEFSEISGEKAGDIDFLKVLRKKVVRNQYTHLRNIQAEKEDVITNEDIRTTILSKWDDGRFYDIANQLTSLSSAESNTSGKFNAQIKLKITDAKFVTSISNINIKSIYYNFKKMEETTIYNHYLLKQNGSKERIDLFGSDEFIPATQYTLIANELESTELLTKILDRNEIGLKFENYDYINSGINLKYSEVISNVLNNDAKIIYSDGIKTEVQFVAPNRTLKEALELMSKKLSIDKNGDLLAINGIESNATYPIDLDQVTSAMLDTGIWSVFGESDNLFDVIKPQGIYIVSYSKIKDLLDASRTDYPHYPSEDSENKILLKNIYQDDEVLIDITSFKARYYYETYTDSYEEHGASGPGCLSIPIGELEDKRGGTCNAYTCQMRNSSVVEAFKDMPMDIKQLQKIIIVKDSNGNRISPDIFSYGNKLKIIFNKKLNAAKNNIQIEFSNESEGTYSLRSGLISNSCSPGYSNPGNGYKNSYIIKSSTSVYGASRF